MFKNLAVIAIASSLFSGCVSVPMETAEKSNQLKTYAAPSTGNAGLYIYRNSSVGSALKKDIWVNDECVGQSAPNVFFYKEVPGDAQHKVSTESEFSPNDLMVETKAGENYFIKQYIKIGLFVGGADLELVEPEKGKKDIESLGLAVAGDCSA